MSMQNVFTGKNGKITLSTTTLKGLDIETADAKALFKPYFDNETAPLVGRATGIQVAVQTDLDEFHEIGRRHPVVLHPGNIHISGSIDRAYLSGALILLLLGRGAAPSNSEPYVQPAFMIHLGFADPAIPGTTAEIILDGVKFQNWGLKIPEDDFVMENVTFRALSLQINDSDPKANPLQGPVKAS